MHISIHTLFESSPRTREYKGKKRKKKEQGPLVPIPRPQIISRTRRLSLGDLVVARSSSWAVISVIAIEAFISIVSVVAVIPVIPVVPVERPVVLGGVPITIVILALQPYSLQPGLLFLILYPSPLKIQSLRLESVTFTLLLSSLLRPPSLPDVFNFPLQPLFLFVWAFFYQARRVRVAVQSFLTVHVGPSRLDHVIEALSALVEGWVVVFDVRAAIRSIAVMVI